MQGGGGPLLTGNSAQSVPDMSSRIYFGICPTIPVARNAGLTLNQVQGDKISSLRAVVDRVAIKSTLVLRLAFSCSTRGKRAYVLSALRTPLAHANATARACAKERAGKAGLITLRQNLPTYRGSASGTPRRALDSTQGKPCSVALLGLAFTMAEILLSLTIIGVVAAITLPSLTGNINERTWNTQRKALYARFSQAIALMPALNGYGTLTEDSSSGASDAVDTAAETFVTDGLSKVLKINNICDSEHLEDCGIVDKFTNFAGSVVESFPKTLKELNILFTEDISTPAVPGVIFKNPQANINTKVAAFETANGESVAVFYNPQCQPAMSENSAYYVMPKMCANFIYDLNGNKGPNTVGKDIGFMSILYPTDSFVVAPVVLSRSSNVMDKDAAVSYCRNLDSESRLPTTYELMSMVYNNILFGDFIDGSVWSSSVLSSEKAWRQSFKTGQASPAIINEQYFVFCVKRN